MTPEIPSCPLCKAKLTEHHAASCKHWGQVLPSEIPGYLESVLAELLLKGKIK